MKMMKKWKQILRRSIAACAAGAMIVTMMPVSMVHAADGEKELVLHYDFKSLTSGTIVNDVSGNGKAGVVRPTGSEVKTEAVEIFGSEHTAFVMNGGKPDATHAYVEMPTGVLNGLEDVTISCWAYVNSAPGAYQRIWDIGSNMTSYMYLLADGGNDGHKGYTSAITASGWKNEKGPEKQTAIETGKWVLTTVTFDGSEKSMSLYEDNKLIGTTQTDVDLSALEGSTKNMIGYGQFDNDILNGKVADFKIYNYAMTAEEVAAQFDIPDAERVQRDYDALTLGDISAVTGNLTLPTAGAAGSAITWKSDNEAVIAADGTVTRPQAGAGDAEVKLTATIASGTESKTKEFIVTVKQMLTNKQTAEADAAAIDLGNLNAVTENLVLPSVGTLGSAITWKSSDESILTNDGVVIRPKGEAKQVTLTATVTYEGETVTREFKVTVMPTYDKKEIKSVEEVNVETRIGALPNLPAQVEVTYDDDSKGNIKVVWPTNLKAADFSAAGTKEVTGTLVDTDVTAKAKVTIVDKEATAPAKAADSFDLSEISMDGDDTIFSQNMNRALEYLKIMDADRMLYNFRKTFGQDTKDAKALTGWDEPTGLLRGHSTGHFMSALAQAYATTGNKEYKDKMDYMIAEMRKLQILSKGEAQDFKTKCTPNNAGQSLWSTDPSTWGEGFISAYSPDQFALLEQYTPYATIWAPYYTLHKLFAGFIDCYNYGGNEEALEIAKDLGTWVYKRLSACTPEQRSKMWAMYIAGEYGGMNESLARLYEITKDPTYLEASKMFDNTDFFNGLANNVDTIQGRHANQHIPQIVGAVHEYAASGDAKYYNIAQNFWEMTVSRYAYSIGGVGTGERFKDPYEQGVNILGNNSRGENCETCAAYNMLKLTMDLYNYNPDDASYMDYYERTMINQIAASQSHDTKTYMHNGVTYMLPIDPGQKRDYDSDYGGFTCCNGTGMENHVKYQAAAYAHTADTLYVNLYMPTTVDWAEKNVSVKQETKFPSEHSKLTVTGSGEFTMKLRVPYWATEGFTVKVNNEVVAENPEVSSYVEVKRTWKNGDVVTIEMPYTLHLDKTPDKVDGSTVASLMYGPMVMVAKDTNASYTPMNWYSVVLSEDLAKSVDVVTGTDADTQPHLTTNSLDFYPMYEAYNYRYHAYVKVDSADDPVNKTALQELVDSVTGDHALNEKDYTSTTWKAFQEALKAAQDILADEKATQTPINKAATALQEAIDGLEERPVIQQDKLEASAQPDCSFCSSWETLDAVNDGIVGSASLGLDCKHFGTWGNHDAKEEWVSYVWDEPVYIDTTEMYFFDNSNGGDGGVQVPASYKYEYLDAEGNWTEVTGADGYGLDQDKFNVTTFDKVQTTGFRVTMVKKADAVGIIEWKVSGTVPSETVDKTKLDAAIKAAVPEADKDKYTESTWTVYAKALNTAKEVQADKDATQKQVDDATKALTDAQKALKEVEKPTPVDKTKLDAAIKAAVPEADKDKYTESTWTVYAKALNTAKEVQADKDATQKQVDDAVKALTDAQKALKEVEKPAPVDKTALDEAIKGAISDADKDKYTESTWSDYADALKKAKDVQADKDAAQKEVDDAVKALNDAQKALKEVEKPAPVDKSALDAAIKAAISDKDKDKYTEATWDVYAKALKSAKEVQADKDATQKDVDSAVKALTDAQKALKESKPVQDIFKDISESNWYRDNVQYVYDHEYMTGLNEEEFGPEVVLSRSHFATILYRIEGEPDVEYDEKFTDVPDNDFYTDAVMWASSEDVKVIAGYLDGRFGPADAITREQFATMMYRYAKYKGYDIEAADDLKEFPDAGKVSPFAEDAVKWAVAEGLIKGDNGNINPQGAANRAECATIIYRFMENVAK